VSPLPLLLLAVLGVLSAGPLLVGRPLFEETDVFVGGQDDINTYRIPSVACTAQGTVLVFCEARKDNNQDGSPTDLVVKRSLGNAGPWDPPTQAGPVPGSRSRAHNMSWLPMQTVLAAKGEEAFMNPVPVIDREDGTIYLLVNHHPRYDAAVADTEGSHIWLLKSTDEGATWSAPVDLAPSIGPHELGPGVGIQMRRGRFVVPVYDGVVYSDDRGKTWKAGARTTGPICETQIVERVDGSLLLNTRSAPQRTLVISKDGGETWGEPHPDPALTDSELWGGCQASLLRYSWEGRNRILFANPANRHHRFDLTVRMSYDDGATWSVAKRIKQGVGGYSCLTVFPDGTVGLIYETGNSYEGGIVEYYAKLSFARFNLEWLTDGADASQTKR
jgi:sialidase-1